MRIRTAMMISLVVIGNIGCSIQPTPEVRYIDRITYKTVPLERPERPVLPTWKGSDMSCLSDEMKQKIRDRDRIRRQYAEDLEAIIDSTKH